MRFKIFAFIYLFAVGTCFSVSAVEGIRLEKRVDWTEGILYMTIIVDIPQESVALPKARQWAEKKVEMNSEELLLQAIGDIPADSFYLIEEYLRIVEPELLNDLKKLAHSLQKISSTLSKDLKSCRVEYLLPLYPDLISLFIKHERPYSPPTLLEWEPTNRFSGIVIYMKDLLPVHGKREEARISPALFPEIYDTDMNLLVEKNAMDPEMLRRWGSFAYTTDFNETPYTERIGQVPLRILGVGLFGKYNTDIVISRENARKIMATRHNRDLLAQGRVLVICDFPQ